MEVVRLVCACNARDFPDIFRDLFNNSSNEIFKFDLIPKCVGLGHWDFTFPTSDFDKWVVYFGYKHPFGIDGSNRFLIGRLFDVEIHSLSPDLFHLL